MKTILLLLALLLLPVRASEYSGELSIWRDLPFRVTFTLYQDDARTEPVDITGWTFVLKIKTNPDGVELESCTMSIASASGGKVQADLTNEETGALDAQRATWDLVGTDSTGFAHYITGGFATIRTPNSR